MMTVDDFTSLPEGRCVPDEGTVVRCPRCGRNGVFQQTELCGPWCLHAETTTVLCDGMLVEPTDRCELPSLR